MAGHMQESVQIIMWSSIDLYIKVTAVLFVCLVNLAFILSR